MPVISALDTPWKVRNELVRLLLRPYNIARFKLSGVELAKGARIFGVPIIQKHRAATIRIGRDFSMRSVQRHNPVIMSPGCVLSAREGQSSLVIGDDVGISASAIVCEESITIGSRVLIGANCVIMDTDFHPLSFEARKSSPKNSKRVPVIIGDDVFIGMNCLVMKGANIGNGCVIGAGSVVSGDIPPNTIAAGNPAKVLKTQV